MSNVTKVDKCIACDYDLLYPTLDLGNQPLANSFTPTKEKQEEYPLAINRCLNCNHLQLTHIVNPELIYKNYSYVSGTTKTYVDYMDWFAKWVREYSGHYYGHVLDIGCNDGTQLDAFARIGFRTYGVDPAENLHEISTSKGHKVVCGFWNKQTIQELHTGATRFDVAVSQNAFAHIPDPHTYLKLLRPLISDDGLFFIQTSQADMVLNGEFDTIYHEHISFYNINSMRELAIRSGWNLVDVVKTPIHGTSYVFILSPNKSKPQNIKNLIEMESKLQKPITYTLWASGVEQIKNEFKKVCAEHREKGYRLVGYGAAAKGMTLLNYVKEELDFIIDDNPLKQYHYTPGLNIPITSVVELDDVEEPICFIPLAWNFFDEIVKRIRDRRVDSRDKYVRYFPKVGVQE